MQTVYMVCCIIVTIAIVVGTVHFSLTMIQFSRAAREVEGLAKSINATSPFLSLMLLGGGLVSRVAREIKKLLTGRGKGGKLK